MFTAPPIAAAEWMSFVVPIIIFIVVTLNKLLSAAKPAVPPARPQRRMPEGERPLRPAQPQPPQQAGGTQGQLNAEIEEFLKRANVRRQKRDKGPPEPPRQPAEPREVPLDVQPVKRRERRPNSSVAESVEKHIGTRTFQQRTERLADEVVRADQQMEAHLQQAFSHKVGTLTDDQAVPVPATLVTDQASEPEIGEPGRDASIAAMLADPQAIRRTFILTEILKRPEERW